MTGLAARLRAETADAHVAIEDAVEWERQVATPAAYRRLLERWWGYHAAREPRLREALGEVAIAREKLALIEADLRALGAGDAEIAALPRCEAAAAPLTRAQALGAMYVGEGATMGGQLIARGIRARHGDDAPTAFYFPYGARTGAMWQDWRRALDAAADDGDAVVAEARATFALLADWLRAPPA